jgi:hypothetical protein
MVRIIASLCLILAPLLPAQQSKIIWIQGASGEAMSENLTPAQAREKSLTNAYAEALRQAGIRIDAVQFMQQSETMNAVSQERRANDAFVNVVRTSARGFVTGRRNETWQVENLETRADKPPIHIYKVRLDVQVTIPGGKEDVDYAVKVRLSQPSYRTGDAVRMDITATKDSYFLVFNVAEDSVRQLYPLEGLPADLLPADRAVSFPPSGMRWVAAMPEGWESSQELIVAVATRTRPQMEIGRPIDQGGGYVRSRQAAMMDLMRWLASVPQDQISCCFERIEITGRPSR